MSNRVTHIPWLYFLLLTMVLIIFPPISWAKSEIYYVNSYAMKQGLPSLGLFLSDFEDIDERESYLYPATYKVRLFGKMGAKGEGIDDSEVHRELEQQLLGSNVYFKLYYKQNDETLFKYKYPFPQTTVSYRPFSSALDPPASYKRYDIENFPLPLAVIDWNKFRTEQTTNAFLGDTPLSKLNSLYRMHRVEIVFPEDHWRYGKPTYTGDSGWCYCNLNGRHAHHHNPKDGFWCQERGPQRWTYTARSSMRQQLDLLGNTTIKIKMPVGMLRSYSLNLVGYDLLVYEDSVLEACTNLGDAENRLSWLETLIKSDKEDLERALMVNFEARRIFKAYFKKSESSLKRIIDRLRAINDEEYDDTFQELELTAATLEGLLLLKKVGNLQEWTLAKIEKRPKAFRKTVEELYEDEELSLSDYERLIAVYSLMQEPTDTVGPEDEIGRAFTRLTELHAMLISKSFEVQDETKHLQKFIRALKDTGRDLLYTKCMEAKEDAAIGAIEGDKKYRTQTPILDRYGDQVGRRY